MEIIRRLATACYSTARQIFAARKIENESRAVPPPGADGRLRQEPSA
jgi:hypothetical protein